ncbi:hypothetical protein Q6375_13370 [Clostridium septicum]|uniref:hypothetical protein n=1 Tax=Clostridium septicum TaxID=1504 RepID=UPI00082D8315|nr:hypothetical protein [Clostridium septicum]WLF68952.1 hypothetical protein Q6375_13370 [Clostridium septicum]
MGMMNYMVSEEAIFLDERLNAEEKYFLIGLWSLDRSRVGVVEVTYKDIMDFIKIRSRSKISKLLSNLKTKGYIEMMKTGRATRYFLYKGYLFYKSLVEKTLKIGGQEFRKVKNNSEENIEDKVDVEVSKDNNITKDKVNKKVTEDKNIIKNEYDDGGINGISNMKNSNEKYSKASEIGEVLQSLNGKTSDVSMVSKVGTHNGSIDETLKIQEKNNNIYIRIIECWNSCNINGKEELSLKNKLAMEKALLNFSVYEIIDGISHYSEILKSKYYYSFVWSLKSFLVKDNGIKRFVDKGDLWNQYSLKFKNKDKFKKKMDFTKYIY